VFHRDTRLYSMRSGHVPPMLFTFGFGKFLHHFGNPVPRTKRSILLPSQKNFFR
jgi:hypothetical protein